MTAEELRQELAKVDPSEWGTIAGAVLADFLEAVERADERFREQAAAIERLEQEFARMDERESQHLDTHIRLRKVANKLAEQVNDLDEFSGIGGPLDARVKALEERPARNQLEWL